MEIIRCKDCKFSSRSRYGIYCNFHDDRTKEDGFCHWAELSSKDKKYICPCGSEKYNMVVHFEFEVYASSTYRCKSCGNEITLKFPRSYLSYCYHSDGQPTREKYLTLLKEAGLEEPKED